jgi:hypothetical protein
MNVVVIEGTVGSAVDRLELASGTQVWSFTVSAPLEDGHTHAVPVAWNDPPGIELEEGTDIAVLGTVRRRFFRSGGSTFSRTEVVAEAVVVGTDRRKRKALLGKAAARLQVDPRRGG